MNEHCAGHGSILRQVRVRKSDKELEDQARGLRVDRQELPNHGAEDGWVSKESGSAVLLNVTVTDLGTQCHTPTRA